MDEKVIHLLEQINERLKKIDTTLKTIYKKEQLNMSSDTLKINKKSNCGKNKQKEITDKEDILSNWESKMPYDEIIKKMYSQRT